MNKGSKRVTVRIGQELHERVKLAVEMRNANPGASQQWTVSDYILAAIVEKINHDHRSARRQAKATLTKVDDNKPREFEEDPFDTPFWNAFREAGKIAEKYWLDNKRASG